MIDLIIAVFLVLGSSALASGTEVALFAVPISKVMGYVQEGRKGASSLLRVKEDMTRPIMTIVIINNISNIVGSIIVGAIASRPDVFGSEWLGVFSGVLTFLVIVFAEILPKTVGEIYAERIALIAAAPILLLSRVFFPFVWIIQRIVAPLVRGRQGMQVTSEEEIQALTRMGKQAGVIEDDESEFIHRVFRLNDVTAWDIMTPISRTDVLDGEKTVGEMMVGLREITHTRLPVYEDNLDHIVGIANMRNLLEELADGRTDTVIGTVATEATFIPSSVAADDLLRHFQQTKQHLAVVVNALGNVLGVVSLEDVLEEIVGDIIDETDEEHDGVKRIGKNAVLVDAACELSTIYAYLGIEGAEDTNGRVGEIIIDELGRIPQIGEEVIVEPLRLVVEDATPRLVKRLRVERSATRISQSLERPADS